MRTHRANAMHMPCARLDLCHVHGWAASSKRCCPKNLCNMCQFVGPSCFGGFRPPTMLSFGACRAANLPSDGWTQRPSETLSKQCVLGKVYPRSNLWRKHYLRQSTPHMYISAQPSIGLNVPFSCKAEWLNLSEDYHLWVSSQQGTYICVLPSCLSMT